MENKKCGCGCEETPDEIDGSQQNKDCCEENPVTVVEECCTEAPVKDELEVGCCEEASSPPEEDIGCCEDNAPVEDGGCCQDAAEAPEDSGCGCGGEFADESMIANPDNPLSIAADAFFEEFEKFAHLMGIVSIGYTHVIPELINTEEPPLYPNAIVLTLEMGKDIIETEPGPEAQKLNDATYAKLGHITYALSDYIRAKGFATQVAHPYGGLVSFSPLGQEAGLGWIGQSGLLITPELGPRLKISAILTSIENLPIKKPEDYSWIVEYCKVCGKCIKACPEEAMIEKESCCGEKDIEFMAARCIGCNQGCTYCIEECPFDTKGYQQVKDKFDKMNAKLMEKRNKSS